jgi:hypothetical protein
VLCVFFAPKTIGRTGRDEYTYRGVFFLAFYIQGCAHLTEGRNATLPSKRTGASMGGFKKHFFVFCFFAGNF